MKKIISLLMVFVMVLSLAACGGTTDTESSSDSSDKTESSKDNSKDTSSNDKAAEDKEEVDPYAPIEGKEYVINMTKYKKEPTPDDAVLLTWYEEEFDVDINLWNLDQNKYVELLNLRISGGEIPDRMYLSGQAGIEQNLYDQGILLPIDIEVFEKYAPNMMAMLNKLKPGWEEYCKASDGTLIKLPDFSIQPNEQAIIWRGDWLEAVGITETPRTLEEFEAALYAFAHEDPDGNGKDDTYGASLMVLQSVFGAYGAMPYWSFGYEKNFGNVWHERDGELVYAGIQPEMKEALALLNKWYEDGVLDPEFVTGENQGGYWANSHPFLYSRIGFTGHGAIYHWMPPTSDVDQGGANYKELMNIDPAIAESLVYGEPPVGPNGHRGVSGVSYVDNSKGFAFGSHLADEPDKLGKMLQMMDYQYVNYENNVSVVYGEEGVHYETQDVTGYDGKTYTIFNQSEEAKSNGDQFFLNGFRLFPAYFEDAAADPKLAWKLEHNIGEEIYTNDLNGTLPSDTMYGAELEKLTSETYYKIITGEKPIEYFDEYVELWKSSGGDVFYEEANAQ